MCALIFVFIYTVATALSWFASGTGHIVFIHIISVAKSVLISIAKNRVSKSSSMTELCFHRFVHFDCVSLCSFLGNCS